MIRILIKTMTTALSVVIVIVLGWSFGAYLINPFYKKSRAEGFVEISGFSSLVKEQPTKLNFQYVDKDAFIKKNKVHEVWVIKHSAKNVTVFSPICPHLGCIYNWDGHAQKFICPCHGSIFNLTGKVLAGPAPRPLDTLPWMIKKGKLYVEWELFKPGIPEKVVIGQ